MSSFEHCTWGLLRMRITLDTPAKLRRALSRRDDIDYVEASANFVTLFCKLRWSDDGRTAEFTSSETSAHSVTDSDPGRIQAHWEGFVATAQAAYVQAKLRQRAAPIGHGLV